MTFKEFKHSVVTTFWTSKIGMAINVLLGRPTMFRMKVVNGSVVVDVNDHSIIRECLIKY